MANMLTHRPKASLQILQYDYNPDLEELQITFTNNAKYVYGGVPAHVYTAATIAPSAGVYFHSVIKRHYPVVSKRGKEQ